MKYAIILIASATVLIGAILASGCQLDGSCVFAVLVASCLPAWLAHEYRHELWPARREHKAAAVPVAEQNPATTAPAVSRGHFPVFAAWHRPVSSLLVPAIVERETRQ